MSNPEVERERIMSALREALAAVPEEEEELSEEELLALEERQALESGLPRSEPSPKG